MSREEKSAKFGLEQKGPDKTGYSESYVASPDVRSSIANDSAVLLDVGRGKYYCLNHVARVIWEDLVAGRSLAEILDALTKRFNVPRERLAADLALFVEALRSKGLCVARRD